MCLTNWELRLYCFGMILGYSRTRYVEFSLQMDVFSLIQGHMNAFDYYRGFPREILYDNMKRMCLAPVPISTEKIKLSFAVPLCRGCLLSISRKLLAIPKPWSPSL